MFPDLADFRLRCYRHILMLDTADCGTMHDETHFWTEASAMVRQCLAAIGSISSEVSDLSLRPVGRDAVAVRAQFLLTALLALQVGIRDYALINQVVTQALALLPQLKDTHLRTHLLVHLYAETEDEALLTEARSLISQWPESSLSEEDRFLLQTYNAIEEEEFDY